MASCTSLRRGQQDVATILFPHPDTNGGENAITAAREDVVPDEGWFAFDDTPGNEEIFIVLSKEKLESLPGFGAPVRQLESVSATVVDNVTSNGSVTRPGVSKGSVRPGIPVELCR